MNKHEYAKYLGSLIEGFEINEERDLSEQFYAFFQCFMPFGENVEKVFEPLYHKDDLLERLLPIYQATASKTLKQYQEGVSPGYFCPEPTKERESVILYGEQHIAYLKEFAAFLEDDELLEMLNKVTAVEFFDEEPEIEDDNLNFYLNDAVSDWGKENSGEEEPVSVLVEAYYSIGCDNFLAYYFQYPAFNNKPSIDFLKPYFKIWKSGCCCKFDSEKLKVFRR